MLLAVPISEDAVVVLDAVVVELAVVSLDAVVVLDAPVVLDVPVVLDAVPLLLVPTGAVPAMHCLIGWPQNLPMVNSMQVVPGCAAQPALSVQLTRTAGVPVVAIL